jgi:membrane-associated phospholipid phosphatase
MTLKPEQATAQADTSQPNGRTTAPGQARAGALLLSWRGVLGLVAAFAGLTAAVSSGVTARIDRSALNWFTPLDHSESGHALARAVVNGGQLWLVGTLVLAAASVRALRARSWRPVLVSAMAVSGLSLALAITKHLVGRTSPHSGLNAVLDQGSSYPSGHAAAATLCLLLLAALTTRVRAHPTAPRNPRWVTAVAIGVGIATVILGYHWPADVIGGWAPRRRVLPARPAHPHGRSAGPRMSRAEAAARTVAPWGLTVG